MAARTVNRIAILITCYNRREKTLACLRALYSSDLPIGTSAHVILVDDGSSDGTAEAVTREFPDIEILQGNGRLFWGRGMHRAFSHALGVGYDGYLWLNDDTILYKDSMRRAVATAEEKAAQVGRPCVVVGSTHDDSGALSYGGSVKSSRLRRFRFRKVWSQDEAVECEVMNGNCVLVPHAVAEVVGNIDPVFIHAIGDVDYALRVRKAGMHIFVAPGFLGACRNNPATNTYLDRDLSISTRMRLIAAPKGLPPAAWYRFTRQHGGFLWPLHFIWPYVKQLAP